MEGGTGALFALRDALEEVLLGVQREGSAGEAVGERAVFFGDGLHERVPRFEPEARFCRSFERLPAWRLAGKKGPTMGASDNLDVRRPTEAGPARMRREVLVSDDDPMADIDESEAEQRCERRSVHVCRRHGEMLTRHDVGYTPSMAVQVWRSLAKVDLQNHIRKTLLRIQNHATNTRVMKRRNVDLDEVQPVWTRESRGVFADLSPLIAHALICHSPITCEPLFGFMGRPHTCTHPIGFNLAKASNTRQISMCEAQVVILIPLHQLPRGKIEEALNLFHVFGAAGEGRHRDRRLTDAFGGIRLSGCYLQEATNNATEISEGLPRIFPIFQSTDDLIEPAFHGNELAGRRHECGQHLSKDEGMQEGDASQGPHVINPGEQLERPGDTAPECVSDVDVVRMLNERDPIDGGSLATMLMDALHERGIDFGGLCRKIKPKIQITLDVKHHLNPTTLDQLTNEAQKTRPEFTDA